MRILRVVPAVALVLGALLGSPAGAASAGNTWAGTWDSDFGKLTLDAGGSGSYAGYSPGMVTGSVTGGVDQGMWTQPGTPTKQGTFTWTMSSDGQSFAGVWAYDTGGCGNACGWGGRCIAGACLANSASVAPPSAPPPTQPPATQPPATQPPATQPPATPPPAASSTVTVVAPATGWGKPTIAASLAAGSATVVASPTLGPTQRGATVAVVLDQKTAMAMVALNGPRKPGDCVYFALAFTNSYAVGTADEELHGDASERLPVALVFEQAMVSCLDLLKHLPPVSGAKAAGVGACYTGAAQFTEVAGRGGRHLTSRRDQRPPLVVSCRRTANGVTVHVQTRSAGQSLRSLVGPRLLLGLYRSASASGSAPVQATFAQR